MLWFLPGVTGGRASNSARVQGLIKLLREVTAHEKSVAVGFGVSGPKQVGELSKRLSSTIFLILWLLINWPVRKFAQCIIWANSGMECILWEGLRKECTVQLEQLVGRITQLR